MQNSIWHIPSHKIATFFSKKSDYCVCIPVINEGEKIKAQLSKMKYLTNLVDIIICDGGSTDNSLSKQLLIKNRVRALLIKTAGGKLSAQLRMGYSYALKQGYKGIITIDGNEKDGIEAIPRIIDKLKEGYDLVQASRFVTGGKAINTPLIRFLAIRLLHAPLISLIAKKTYTDTTNGFRGYSRNYLLHPRVQPFREIFDTYELLAYLSVRANQLGLRSIEVPAIRQYPKSGKIPTKITFAGNLKLLYILLKLLLGSYNPQ